MFRSPISSRNVFFSSDINDWIRSMTTETNWDRIDKSKVNIDQDRDLESDDEALEYVKSILDNCNGALDFLGPPGILLEDLKKLKRAPMSDTVNYLDSDLRTYTAKCDVYPRGCDDLEFRNLTEMGSLFLREVRYELEVRLAGTYEIIPTEWCDQVGKEFQEMFGKIKEMVGYLESKTRRVTPHDLSLVFNQNRDPEMFSYLETYVTEKYVPISELLTLRALKTEFYKTFERHPLVFCSFFACPQESLYFPPVIRLIRDDDDRFLFVDDVERAIRLALRNRKRHDVEINLPINQTAGRHVCISYPDYLKTLERFGMKRNEITLVNVQVQRTSSFAVAMKSPTGIACIPASDAIFSLAKLLLLESEMLQAIKPDKLPEVGTAFIKVVEAMTEGNESMHFIDMTEVEKYTKMLRKKIVELFEPSSSNLKPIKISEETFSYITADRLKETLDYWQFHKYFPSLPNCHVPTGYDDLSRSRVYSRIGLCMAVGDCILRLSGSELKSFLHNQRICKKLPRFSCDCRNRKVEEWKNEQVEKMTVREVNEFCMKPHTLDYSNTPLNILLDKKCDRGIIGSWAARYAIATRLYTLLPPGFSFRSDFSLDRRLLDHPFYSSYFYITMDELNVLSEDVFQKLSQKFTRSMRPDRVRIFNDNTKDKANTTNHLENDFIDCMKYTMDKLESLTAFHEYLPERTAILYLTTSTEKNESVLLTCTKSALEVVHVMLKQNSAFVSDEHWDIFHRLVSLFQKKDGWLALKQETIHEYLKELPIDLSKLHFVPDTDVVREASAVTEEDKRKEEKCVSEVLVEENKEAEESFFDDGSGELVSEEKMTEENVRMFEEKMKKLEKDTQKNTDHIQKLHKAMEFCSVNNEILKKECGAKNDMISELQKALEDQNKKLDGLKEELDDHKKSMKEQKKELDDEKPALNDPKMTLDEQKKKLENEKTALNDQKKKLDEQKKELEKQKTALNDQKKELENHKTALIDQKKKLNDQRKELVDEKTKLNDQKRIMNEMKKELENQKSVLTQLEKTQSDGEKKWKEILETSNRLADGLRTENANLMLQNGKLSESLKTKNRGIDEMKKREKTQMHTIQKEHREQVLNLKKDVQQEKEEKEELRRKVLSLERLLASLKTPGDECGICLAELKGTLVSCQVCSTKWHEDCIEKWLENKALCPVCSRSLPSSKNFPPLN